MNLIHQVINRKFGNLLIKQNITEKIINIIKTIYKVTNFQLTIYTYPGWADMRPEIMPSTQKKV